MGANQWRCLTFFFFLLFAPAWRQEAVDLPSHEPNRCGSLSVPCPGCHGTCSVILCQRFSKGSTGSGLACALPSVYPSSCQHDWILANSHWPMMSRTDRAKCFQEETLLGRGVNVTFVLAGHVWNKRRFICTSLIGTTFESLSPYNLPVSDFMTFVHRRHKKQMWELLVSVFYRKTWWMVGLMTSCLPVNMFLIGFMECFSPFITPAVNGWMSKSTLSSLCTQERKSQIHLTADRVFVNMS